MKTAWSSEIFFFFKIEKALYVQDMMAEVNLVVGQEVPQLAEKESLMEQGLGGDENLGEEASLGKAERRTSRGRNWAWKTSREKEGLLRKRWGKKGLTHDGYYVLWEFGESKLILVLDFLVYLCISGAWMEEVPTHPA